MTDERFHISKGFNDIPLFEPRVPQTTCRQENDSIPRICVAKSLEGCLMAHPEGVYYFSDFPKEPYFNFYDLLEVKHTLLTDFKSGQFYTVYHFDVAHLKELSNEELVSSDLVWDAKFTGESWILEGVKPLKKSYLFVEEAKLFYSEDRSEIIESNFIFRVYSNLNEIPPFLPSIDFFCYCDEEGITFNAPLSEGQIKELETGIKKMKDRNAEEQYTA